jgi:DNA-directed RNA polymerase subunit RPC12/RpoP
MAIYGTYACDDCNVEFKGWRESEGPYPDCPHCGTKGGWAPQAPNIIGVKAKAIDIAQKVAEETFGLTDMNDNNRPGDIVVKSPSPIQTAESEAITREYMAMTNAPPEIAPHLQGYVKSFFGAAEAGNMPSANPMAQIQGAAPAAAEARSQGVDPIGLLHKSKTMARSGINNLTVVAKDSGKT